MKARGTGNLWVALAILLLLLWGSGYFGPVKPDREILEEVPAAGTVGADRSGRWSTVRSAHISRHPLCEACGSADKLNVHHIIPFHVNSYLELDPTNLITLCRNCHFVLGHDSDGPDGPKKPNWKDFNPHVRQDATERLRETSNQE